MKQIDWFSFYPKAMVLKNYRSCCLYYFSVLCKSFSKNSFFWLLVSSETSVALATEVVRLIRPLAMTRLKQASFCSFGLSRSFSKADAKVQLFRTRAKYFEGKVCKKSIFLTVIYILKRRDGGVTFYYTCDAGGRVGAHKRLLEGRDRGRWTRNTRYSRENIREVSGRWREKG